jgi:DNA adenine methylase
MKYMGSKNKYVKELLPILLKDRKENQFFIEPFCGGCGILKNVTGNRIGNDVNKYLISFIKALQNDWLPPIDISEELYKAIQQNKEQYPMELVGYVGFQLSYGAKWFGGYRRDSIGKRNYSLEAFNNINKDVSLLKNINFYNVSYNELLIPDNSIIYCDPPYQNTTKYTATNTFNHDLFWEWCRKMSQEGHIIYISEYNAPDDFICVWKKDVNNTLNKNTGEKKGTEKLFTI